MPDQYGGLQIPVPIPESTGQTFTHPEIVTGDELIGHLAQFLASVITTYAGDAWTSCSPAQPIIKSFLANDPEDNFNENLFPCLYVYRPGRETREQVEVFEQVADDYRFQKSRVESWWILDTAAQEVQRQRNQMIDAVRKNVDRAVHIGRDIAWIVPGDTDPKAATHGSSLANYTGAAVIELLHAAPADYVKKMILPAPDRKYQALKVSFYIEELYIRDVGTPQDSLAAEFISPDQGTGLGPYDLGDAEYK